MCFVNCDYGYNLRNTSEVLGFLKFPLHCDSCMEGAQMGSVADCGTSAKAWEMLGTFCSASLAAGQRLCPGCAPSLHSPSAAFSCLCWCLQPWGVALCGCCCFRQPGALPGSWLSAHCGHSESKEPRAAQSNLCWKKLCSRDPGCVECQFILGLVLILVRKCLPSPCSEGEQQTHFWSGWHRARWV